MQYSLCLGCFEASESYFKKNTTSYKEQDPEKVHNYIEALTVLEHLPIVYIDETGIDTYLYRKNARAPRGEKVYESVSGRRFKRTSIVSGQVNHRLSLIHISEPTRLL